MTWDKDMNITNLDGQTSQFDEMLAAYGSANTLLEMMQKLIEDVKEMEMCQEIQINAPSGNYIVQNPLEVNAKFYFCHFANPNEPICIPYDFVNCETPAERIKRVVEADYVRRQN